MHTKGRFARTAFILEGWQEHDIIRPLFGEVIWSKEIGTYVRRYRVANIVIGRKNGKSELAAGIVLYLLVGDDEESAEIYGAAKDTKQAKKVGEVVERMRLLSPALSRRLGYNKNERRIYDETSGSYYEIITADALGELGHNPHGFVLDEVLSQPDASLWEALRTAAGTRAQPLFLLITTETNEPASFGAQMIDEAEKVAADPKRAPHVFSYVRKLPMDADPWDEANWVIPNPALGTFLSLESLRQEALEAKNEPQKENSFRQFRLNQRVQQVTRFMPLHLWDANGRMLASKLEEDLLGERCVGGLDLASTTDLASMCWLFPGEPHRLLWRFWTPEAQIPKLDEHTGGMFSVWAREGFITVTEGDWIDLATIERDIDTDLTRFTVEEIGYDPWGATSTVQWLQAQDATVSPIKQTYEHLSEPTNELMRLVKAGALEHAGNPIARYCADSLEVRRLPDQPDVLRPVKPDRRTSGKRIDGMVALIIALRVQMLRAGEPQEIEASLW